MAVDKTIYKTIYRVEKMDCPAEEQMIRMKLSGLSSVVSIEVDIPDRRLVVYHTGDHGIVSGYIDGLNLDSHLISSIESKAQENTVETQRQRKVLLQVLFINLFFFGLEIITGFLADSMGLIGDSLDMLADSIVYGLSLYAVGAGVSRKKMVAGIAGYFQVSLAILGFIEVIRRFAGYGYTPDFKIMIIISVFALIGNVLCLFILQRSKNTDAHMQASMIFTSNDVIVNTGVIVAGIFVYITASRIPDLIIGAIVFIIVGRGAYRIIRLSR